MKFTDLNAALPSERSRIGQTPLTTGVFRWYPLDVQARSPGDLWQSFVAPGNAGTAQIAENVDLRVPPSTATSAEVAAD
jgi:hypothetical protein